MKFWFLTPFAAFALAGCSSPPPLQTFPTLDYSYLPPIVLKVASLNVVNNYVPTPSQATLIGQDPAPPATVLLTMLNHRIIASGAPGTGTVTIANASIDQIGNNLTGTMTVDINVSSPNGHSTGYAEATVSASRTAPATDASQNDMQAALYGLTKQLMTNMNVQLQYQIQHNLGSWLSWSGAPGSSAPAAGATPGLSGIQAIPLTAPAGSAPATGAPFTAPAAPANTTPAVPSYLPGAGPAALAPAAAQ
jgi:hypothetical protein